jgi:hypothetical protein
MGSFLALTFVSPCLGRKPKARVVTATKHGETTKHEKTAKHDKIAKHGVAKHNEKMKSNEI